MTRALALVEGRKKGGGGREAPDTLRSTQVAEVVLLLQEGEMQGIVNGLKSVYVDGVPLENADGSRNFEDVFFAYATGALGQQPLPGIEAVQNEVSVGVQVNQGTPVVRTINNAAVDHVRVTIFVPQLTDLDVQNGNLNGSWFEWSIEVQSAGGGFVLRHQEILEGKSTTGYSRAVRLELTGSAPWDVRVKRLTAAPPSNIESDFLWSSYTEIQSIKLRYQNSAVAVLRLSAKAFSRVPTIAVDAMNRRVWIPSNYNPITRVYTGVWNGTFAVGWTACPPWVLYDVITDVRAGAGDWVAPTIANKWSLYAIGQYCDVMVSDGRGGFEPRFTCNVNIETRVEAFRLIRDLAAIFRGMVFWASDQVDFAQDAPSDPVHTFTPANVYEGRFTYSDVSEKTRHSVFICWWNDLAQLGRRVPEIYVDDVLVARYGLRELELAPLGLTSRGQAARACRWARHSEQDEGEVVTFEVGSDGVAVAPGKVFKIADPNEQGERLGGRIKTATTTLVTLDAPVTLAAGETYELTVLQPDAANPVGLKTEKRTVTTPAGTVSAIALASAFSAAPAAGSVWLLESNAIGATTWRCLGVEEVKGSRRFRITAIAHNPSKYSAIENGLVLDQRPVSRIGKVVPRVASVAVAETAYLVGTEYRSKVTVSWPEPARGLTYRVAWRLSLGPWTFMPETTGNTVDIDSLPAGVFECWVQSVNSLGNAAQLREATPVTLQGKTVPPPNGSGFGIALVQGAAVPSWLFPAIADYLSSEVRWGPSWEAGAVLFEGHANHFTWNWPPIGTQTLWLKHYDTSLNESAAAVPATVNVTSALYVQWGDVTGSGKPPDFLNWDFTKGTEGWSGVTSTVVDATASGAAAGVLPAGAEAYTQRTIPIDTTRTYRVRARLKRSAGAGGSLYVGLRCVNSAGDTIDNTSGGSHPYAAAAARSQPVDGNWHVYEGIVSGVEPVFPTATPTYARFWPGTVAAAPLVLAIGGWAGDLAIDYCEIADITDAGIVEAQGFTAYKLWEFTRALEGWSASGATLSVGETSLTISSTGTDPNLRIGGLSFAGGLFSKLRVRLRRLAGTGWDGRVFYSTAGHVEDGGYFKEVQAQPQTGWTVLEWDMAQLDAGGNDWLTNQILALRFDFGTSAADQFEIDWIAIGKAAPAGESVQNQWVGRGVTILGDTAIKTLQSTAWDADFYTRDSYSGGCFVAAAAGDVDKFKMFGLNSDPLTDLSYSSLDFAWFLKADATAEIYENGVVISSHGAYSLGDVFAIVHRGIRVQYMKNGVVLRETTISATTPYFGEGAMYDIGAKLTSLRFGPLSKVADIFTEQAAPNAWTQIYQDSYDVGGATPPAGAGPTVMHSFSITPPVDCIVEFSGTISASQVLPDAGNSLSWAVTPAGGSLVTLASCVSTSSAQQTFPGVNSFSAVGGVELVFELRANRVGGNPAMPIGVGSSRYALVKR